MRVAIIDDGVDSNFNQFHKDYKYMQLLKHEFTEIKEDSTKAELTHGTICSIIFTYYTRDLDYELISLKIMEGRFQKTSRNHLEEAFAWCMNNDIDLICMSIGTSDCMDFSQISKWIELAVKENIIIIAAGNNRGTITYPACHPAVIGVRCDPEGTLKEGEWQVLQDDIAGIDIETACSYPELTKIIPLQINPSNSFAVPFICAEAAPIIKAGSHKKEAVIDHFRKNGINKIVHPLEHIRATIAEWKHELDAVIIDEVTTDGRLVQQMCEELIKKEYNAIGFSAQNVGGYILNYQDIIRRYQCKLKDVLEIGINIFLADVIIFDHKVLAGEQCEHYFDLQIFSFVEGAVIRNERQLIMNRSAREIILEIERYFA